MSEKRPELKESTPKPASNKDAAIGCVLILVILGVVGSVINAIDPSILARTNTTAIVTPTEKPDYSIDIPTLTPTPTLAPVAWYPSGYNTWLEDNDIAWKWVPGKELECGYSSGSCWGIYVIPKYGCSSSLYAEITIFDNQNVQIDYANDLTSAVGPSTKVKLIFNTFNDDADTGKVSKISCY